MDLANQSLNLKFKNNLDYLDWSDIKIMESLNLIAIIDYSISHLFGKLRRSIAIASFSFKTKKFENLFF